MTRLLVGAVLVLLAGCGTPPRARPAPSGITAGAGGGEVTMGTAPRGTTTTPYR